MCAASRLPNRKGLMDEALFWSAVEQCYELGARRMCPFIDGDPFADHRIPRFVEQLANRYPDLKLYIYTNGMFAHKRAVERIVNAGNTLTLIFSIQGGTKDVFERITGLHWETVMRNLRNAIACANGSKTQVKIAMCQYSETMPTLPEFIGLGRSLGVEACPGLFSNFGGAIHDDLGESMTKDWPRRVCDRAISHVYVRINGDVDQCCFDVDRKYVYGNLNHQSLREIIESERFQAMRRAHLALDVEAMPECCKDCNAPRFHG